MCNNIGLLGTLTLVKRVILLIQIIVPIILIGSVIVSLIKLLNNPEEKNGTKKIINQFIAAIIIFFIPLLVNVVMNIAGDNTNFSSCWNSASDKITLNNGYIKFKEKERKPIIYDPKKYEKGKASGYLDFSCVSKTVHSQFSCETLEIVEKHLYDFDATNFNQKIASYGGFAKYARSVGGIFGEYYGKKMPHETVADFQRAAEYVLGWMYMYGWDYKNGFGVGEGEHLPWGGRNMPYTPDAFYVHGGWERKYVPDYPPYSSEWWKYGTDFDHVISGKNGGVGAMSSECGDLEVFVFNKLGIVDQEISQIKRLKDLKVGDGIYYLNTSAGNGHNAMIGEVYDDHIVIYDAAFMVESSSQNYKRVLYYPKEDSAAADLEAVQSVVGFRATEWFGRRFHNFKEGE